MLGMLGLFEYLPKKEAEIQLIQTREQLLFDALQLFLEEAGRVALVAVGDLLRCAGREDGATTTTTFWSHVDDVVGLSDDVEVVLDDDNGVAAIYQTADDGHEDADVLEVQTRGRLVEDVERLASILLRELGSQLDALALTAREGGCWVRSRRIRKPG